MLGTIVCVAAFAFFASVTIWLVIYSIDEFSNCKHFRHKSNKD